MSDAHRVVNEISTLKNILFQKMKEQNTLLAELVEQITRIADSIESNANNNPRSP